MPRLRLRAADAQGAELMDQLRRAYDRGAADRDRTGKEPWKLAEREAFLGRLRELRCTGLLELGAGTGQDSEFFRQHGLEVVAVDLSPAMVERCRQKGVDARVMDFRHHARQSFEIVNFHGVDLNGLRFQSLTLRRPTGSTIGPDRTGLSWDSRRAG